jgi:hypothetical protein
MMLPAKVTQTSLRCHLTLVSPGPMIVLRSWQTAIVDRIGTELAVSLAAAAVMAAMVLVAGAGLTEVAPISMSAPALQPRAGELWPVAIDVDDSDAVVVTRRKAAAREIERQWHTYESTDDSPVVPDPRTLTTAVHESP